MGTERGPVESEHSVADLEGRDATADRLDFSTLTSTSLSLAAGFSTSEIRTTSGGPYLV